MNSGPGRRAEHGDQAAVRKALKAVLGAALASAVAFVSVLIVARMLLLLSLSGPGANIRILYPRGRGKDSLMLLSCC